MTTTYCSFRNALLAVGLYTLATGTWAVVGEAGTGAPGGTITVNGVGYPDVPSCALVNGTSACQAAAKGQPQGKAH